MARLGLASEMFWNNLRNIQKFNYSTKNIIYEEHLIMYYQYLMGLSTVVVWLFIAGNSHL